jgi:hypothetical protein
MQTEQSKTGKEVQIVVVDIMKTRQIINGELTSYIMHTVSCKILWVYFSLPLLPDDFLLSETSLWTVLF